MSGVVFVYVSGERASRQTKKRGRPQVAVSIVILREASRQVEGHCGKLPFAGRVIRGLRLWTCNSLSFVSETCYCELYYKLV